VYSYVVQAARQAQRGELAAAQKTLRDMADNNRQSEFAALALYESAIYAERQGLERNFREAYEALEEMIKRYPNDELVFYARLRQGDLLRKLNDFGPARVFYESLLNNFPQHPDVLLAQMALADTLFAQGTNTPANYNDAAAIFDRLRDLATAPLDLRVEAGYKWGFTLLRRGETTEAKKAFWSVVDAFLLDKANAGQLGSTGRFWISRTLLELGQLLEDAGDFDEAIRAYRLIVEHRLGPEAQAQAKLQRYRTGGDRGTQD
jgi:cellulose synthase operon protein C